MWDVNDAQRAFRVEIVYIRLGDGKIRITRMILLVSFGSCPTGCDDIQRNG